MKGDPLHVGAHKGYGFAEYADGAAASSAIRLLNGRMLGARNLKLDTAASTLAPSSGVTAAPVSSTDRLSDIKTDAQIAAALSSFTPYEMWTMLTKFKEYAERDEAEAKVLLTQRPDLGQALLQMQKTLLNIAPVPPAVLPAPAAVAPTYSGGGLLPLPVPMPLPDPAPVAPEPVLAAPLLPIPDPVSRPLLPAPEPPSPSVALSDPRLRDPRLARDPRMAAAAAQARTATQAQPVIDQDQLKTIRDAMRMTDTELSQLTPSQLSEVTMLRDALTLSYDDVLRRNREDFTTLWKSMQPYKPFV
jgi:Hinge domain of cleavage stimulation factor subunit 2/RNA recognition motif. (a.k.a. RRM, RBD, or RNP domain)